MDSIRKTQETFDFKIENAKPEDVETIRGIIKASWMELYPNETYGITAEDIATIDWYNFESLEKRRKEIIENQDTVHVWVVKNKNKISCFYCGKTSKQEGNS